MHVIHLISDVPVHPARSDAVGNADDDDQFINGLNCVFFSLSAIV